jgi:hypothetical protein
MSLDQHTTDQHATDQHTTNTGPTENTAAAALSNQVFSDPKAFLAVLQKDYSQIESTQGKGLTQEDLSAYAKNGENPMGRAAAQIAADHYSDLSSMSRGSFLLQRDTDNRPGITQKDLTMDQKLASGNVSDIISTKEWEGVPLVLGAAASAGMVGALIPESLAIPPLAIGEGTLAAGFVGAAAAGVHEMKTLPTTIRTESQTAQHSLGTWIGQQGNQVQS